MIDHVSLPVSDLVRASAFYDAVLAPLHMVRLFESESRIGYGKSYPEFWINLRVPAEMVPDGTGFHICLRARSAEAVTAFHDVAVRSGGRSDGAPGLRKATMVTYFAAFIRDPDNNKIEAMTVPAKEGA